MNISDVLAWRKDRQNFPSLFYGPQFDRMGLLKLYSLFPGLAQKI